MTLSLLPDECFNNILFFLDYKTLYKCLLVNRYYCKFSIPLIWRDPFIPPIPNKCSLINTLISCLNDEEISSLKSCLIYFEINNNTPPLFEYGRFIRKIDHDYCVNHINSWIKSKSSNKNIKNNNQDYYNNNNKDSKVRKLTSIIYNMIMRKGSNLQEFVLFINSRNYYIDLPKFSIFTIYKPGITNLTSLSIEVYFDLVDDDKRYQNTIEFLSNVSKFCNCIINCEFWISNLSNALTKPFLDIIKLQPLERILIDTYTDNYIEKENVEKVIHALEFRSKTLKQLLFRSLDFQLIDLSFLSKLEYLENLEFVQCRGFVLQSLFYNKKFNFKQLKLWHDEDYYYDLLKDYGKKLSNIMVVMLNSFCSKSLLKLSLNIITPDSINAVKLCCPYINSLNIKIFSDQSLDLIIPIICHFNLLKTLKIEIYDGVVNIVNLVEILADHLLFVEYLILDFNIDLSSFQYFIINCKANFKKWIIYIDNNNRKDYLLHVNNYQKIHNSLKILGINKFYNRDFDWTNDELEVIGYLKDQGVDIISSDELDINYLS
ncbi:uncharacterized protein OCT59_016507 [Rhizophagus irregularis]|uniref:F-box domain-containing protein n=2 Tax=Rhizophagus irregularis TaxID=588596 RepID=U9TV40_RHIID|nr:hypothetical protein GLOIN_2v637630 [Rhizophagus irregularis DAOM 181602=DAOM 197198]EXX50221.1 hypothetical protein RirG_272920 [Rhizophagus irregularis DAOM 197198w]POG62232.1 hypothetical protein GLOIN_2v637630 [Rhizophagus irregularis DAOM 181602=DAOM 197198]UZO24193.1 hypothetical protein OCT59_016507 [Rhizophagus irregularis]|eukprot:XP_025169098.1 hypothetical protein GLOIN_2v637630 [Rhizophagus irregularis DAOM 181602=DAOM 197198]